jgi:hypothetical protein
MEFEHYTRRAANSGKVLAHETLRVMDGGSAWIETKTSDSLIARFCPQMRQRYQLTIHLGSLMVDVDGGTAVIWLEAYYPFRPHRSVPHDPAWR